MEKTLELLRFLREEKGLQDKKIDLDLILAIVEFIELKLDVKLNLPAVGKSNRKDTLNNFEEILMLLKEAREEVPNGIYNPIEECIQTVVNTYEIKKT